MIIIFIYGLINNPDIASYDTALGFTYKNFFLSINETEN